MEPDVIEVPGDPANAMVSAGERRVTLGDLLDPVDIGANIRISGEEMFLDEVGEFTSRNALLSLNRRGIDVITGYRGMIDLRLTKKQSGLVSDGQQGIRIVAQDATGVNQVNISGATNASPIVITTVSDHGYAIGDKVIVDGVGGNAAANGLWVITVLSSTTFSLDGSSGNGSYTSGGFVTNRGLFFGIHVNCNPSVARGTISSGNSAYHGDDVGGVVVTNAGTARGSDAFYVSDGGAVSGDEWHSAYGSDSDCQVAFYAGGDITVAGLDLQGCTFGSGATAIRLPGGVKWHSGAGTPEGAVTAPIGSLYTRTDGGASTTLYVKEAGSGNTGWVGK